VANADILAKVSSGELSVDDAVRLLATTNQAIADSPLTPIECNIRDAVTQAVKELELAGQRDGATVWTRKVKTALRDLGHREGHLVFGFPHHETPDIDRDREFLFDLVWATSVDKTRYGLTGIALAVEMELSDDRRNKLLDDFLKLTVTNADLRLFIFDIPSGSEAMERKFALLKDACRVPRGNRYLVVGIESYHSTPFRVECRAWTR
jgi:hypothetical protein